MFCFHVVLLLGGWGGWVGVGSGGQKSHCQAFISKTPQERVKFQGKIETICMFCFHVVLPLGGWGWGEGRGGGEREGERERESLLLMATYEIIIIILNFWLTLSYLLLLIYMLILRSHYKNLLG